MNTTDSNTNEYFNHLTISKTLEQKIKLSIQEKSNQIQAKNDNNNDHHQALNSYLHRNRQNYLGNKIDKKISLKDSPTNPIVIT